MRDVIWEFYEGYNTVKYKETIKDTVYSVIE